MHPTKRYTTRALEDITTLTIHHTVSPPDRPIESIAAYHVSKDWPGIGYHFVIKAGGLIYQTNQLEAVSYHAGPGNHYSVGIALQGDFTNGQPPHPQIQAAAWLVGELQDRLGDLFVLPHRLMTGAATACPGATWEAWLPLLT